MYVFNIDHKWHSTVGGFVHLWPQTNFSLAYGAACNTKRYHLKKSPPLSHDSNQGGQGLSCVSSEAHDPGHLHLFELLLIQCQRWHYTFGGKHYFHILYMSSQMCVIGECHCN